MISQIIVISYFALIFFIHYKSRSQDSSLENYFLAGRKLTLPFFVATLVSTWYGNLLGVGEISFRYGLVNWLSQGIFWYFIYLFFAFFIVKRIYNLKLYSIPDQLQLYYGRGTAILGAIINLIMLNPASYVLSMGLIFNLIFQIDKELGMILGALLPIFYSIKGGFKAVVLTDMLQFIFMYLGVFLLLPFAIYQYGAWDFLVNHVPATHLNIQGTWGPQIIIAWFLIALWTLVDPNFYQRTWSASSPETAQRGILISIVCWMLFDVIVTFSGIYAYAILPNADPVMALPLLAEKLLPPILKGIFFTGLLATVMSTLDSLAFSSSMSFAYDIYYKLKPQSQEKDILIISKIALVVILLISLFIANYFQSLMTLIYYRGTLAVSALLIPLMLSIFRPKINHRAGFWSVFAGACSSLLLLLNQELNWLDIKIEPLFIGLFSSALVMILLRGKKV